MIEKLAAKRQQKGIDCDNVTRYDMLGYLSRLFNAFLQITRCNFVKTNHSSTSLPSFQCLCDNSSHINFHWNLEAEFLTAKNRLEAEREMGRKTKCYVPIKCFLKPQKRRVKF